MSRRQASPVEQRISIAPNLSNVVGGAGARHRTDQFALNIASAMLVVNLVGFAPTLYLRPLFDVPPIPIYLYVHGAVGTAWFAFVFVQALLVARRRYIWHRRLGWAIALLAGAVLISGIFTSTNMVPRALEIGATSPAELTLYRMVTSADLSAFIVFPILVLLGVLCRSRPSAHKRLMLLASLSIVGPAAARIWSWFGDIPNQVPIALAIFLTFVVSFIVHDIRLLRWPHPATVFGIMLILIVNAAMRISGIGDALVAQRMGL